MSSIDHRPPLRSSSRRGYLLALAAIITVVAIVAAYNGDAVAAESTARNAPDAAPGDAAARRPRPTGAALDVHTHVASQALTDRFTGGGVPAPGAEDLVARLDEAGVEQAVILSAAYFGAPFFTDDSNVAPENDYVATEIAKYPDRLIGFCGINPLFPSALDEIDRCLELPGMVGIKLHLEGSGVRMDDEEDVADLAAVLDRVAAHDAPVMLHVSDPSGLPLDNEGFANLAGVLSSHPGVRVAHAHCAGNTDDDTIEMWLRLGGSGYNPETSYVDISACLTFFEDAPRAQRELIVWRLRTWGIDHVLFGSDYLSFLGATPEEALETLRAYPFRPQELATILSNDGSQWLGE